MAYNPSRFGTPSSSKLYQQGLLQRKQGSRGLFGPNLQPGGVQLGGRMNLIGGGGPNPYLTKETGNFTKRVSPPTSTAVEPRTFRTGGLKVADILKGAQFGQFAPEAGQPQAPQAGFGQFGPQAAQAQAVQGVQGAQGSTDVLQSATDIGNAYAQKPGEEGPESVLAPAQNFLSRMRDGAIGEKGSGKRSDIGRSMMQAGAQMMKGNPQGTFATIGQGLEAGLGGYQELKEDRRVQSDREEDERRREEINAGVDAAISEQRDVDGNITRRALNDKEAAMVRAAGGAEGVALAASLRQGTRARTAIDTFSLGADDDYLELLRAQPDDIALAGVTAYAKSDLAEAGRVKHLVEMGYSQEVAEVAAQDAAGAQAVLNRGMETTIMRDGSGVLRVFHDGEFVGSAGEGAAVDPLAQAALDAQRESTLWTQSSKRRETVTDRFKVLRDEVDYLPTLVENVAAINDEDIENFFGTFGGLKQGMAKLLNPDDPATWKIGNVDNMLTKLGIKNLSAFKGAISEKELATAMQNAGSIEEVKGLLNAIMARSINSTVMLTEEHMDDARGLDTLLANTTAAQESMRTGTGGRFWSDPTAFGFDMGSKGELDPATGELVGASGIRGMKQETDALMESWIDQAVGGGGGDVNLAPPGSTQPTATPLEVLIATEAATRKG